ncbi:hypothetical protein [Streptomyces sp. NEAU-174]|uniref:hypothetical protein n=1 Tax=Streptomyces sp. NEAU-174 TaxID=3458254 RepID=UPI0040450E32
MPTKTITFESIIDRYAKAVAVVVDEDHDATPATNLDAFLGQLQDAIESLDQCHMDSDDADSAVTYLIDARDSGGAEQQILLAKAEQHLVRARDLFDDYATAF